MSVTHDDLLYAIENSLWELPEIPDLSVNASFHGIKVRWSPATSFIFANLAGAAHLKPDTVDATIQTVHDFFIERERDYAWFIGDMSEPQDLGEHLLAAGLIKVAAFAGMALTDMAHEIKTPSDVTVRVATDDDIEDVTYLFEHGYPVAADFAQVQAKVADSVAGARNYLAFVEGHERPISVASMLYVTDKPIAVLQGAATLPDQRGKGAYSSLVAARLADARTDGMQAVILQADRASSAPICQKLGFEEICGMELYGWLSEAEH